MALYRELLPEDTEIQPSELQLFRVDRVLTNHPYNDLGLLAREKLIVLAEAESEWSENIIYRLAAYYFDTMWIFADRKSMNVHHKMKIDLLDVEAYVIYPGKEKIDQDMISLRDVFFGGVEGKPDFTAKIIHGDYKGGIIAEYMGYCRVYDEQRAALKNDPSPEKWIAATIEECIKQGFLVQYLTEHRTEVEKVMLEMYSPKYVDDAERKTETIMKEIGFARRCGVPDEQIKQELIREHNMTTTYAQRCLDYKPSANTVMAL